jgi:hypothetical protein
MEQHAHPFESSTKPAGFPWAEDVAEFPTISLLSMLTSATSFTITAILQPSLLLRRCCRRVVFPLPKNPEKIVIGIFESSIDFSPISTVEEKSLVTPSPRENGW